MAWFGDACEIVDLFYLWMECIICMQSSIYQLNYNQLSPQKMSFSYCFRDEGEGCMCVCVECKL